MKESSAKQPIRGMIFLLAALAWLFLTGSAAAQNGNGSGAYRGSTYQGFGAETRGGEGQPVYRVTNLHDSGPGSLRDAISKGKRYVVFDVAGEINLASRLSIKGPNLTIDGCTAPSPGITLQGWGLYIRGKHGAHNIIVRCLRSRNAAHDGFSVTEGASYIVLDRLSSAHSGDGAIDITSWNNLDTHDVTVQWSILAQPKKIMLIKYPHIARITLHHNIFVGSLDRNPHIGYSDSGGMQARGITVDFRNNLVANWRGGKGTTVECGAKANIVNNFYSNPGFPSRDQKQAVVVARGRCDTNPTTAAKAYVAGNISNDEYTIQVNNQGNESSPFPAPPVHTTDACLAAYEVLAEAGVKPRDGLDEKYLSTIALNACL